jgi:D-sedoheptulose 7-phosphate isomerase
MTYNKYLEETLNALKMMQIQSEVIESALLLLGDAVAKGGTLFFCGNGGSAADSQHWAAELTGVFRKDGKAMSAIALTVDTSSITAIANDSDYKYVFSRQLEGLGREGDVLIAISTSGNSSSVIEAAMTAQNLGIKVVGISGNGGGSLKNICDIMIDAPGEKTEVIQHVHATIGHYLLGAIEDLHRVAT